MPICLASASSRSKHSFPMPFPACSRTIKGDFDRFPETRCRGIGAQPAKFDDVSCRYVHNHISGISGRHFQQHGKRSSRQRCIRKSRRTIFNIIIENFRDGHGILHSRLLVSCPNSENLSCGNMRLNRRQHPGQRFLCHPASVKRKQLQSTRNGPFREGWPPLVRINSAFNVHGVCRAGTAVPYRRLPSHILR